MFLPLIGAVIVMLSSWWISREVQWAPASTEAHLSEIDKVVDRCTHQLLSLQGVLQDELEDVDQGLMASISPHEPSADDQWMLQRIVGLKQVILMARDGKQQWQVHRRISLSGAEHGANVGDLVQSEAPLTGAESPYARSGWRTSDHGLLYFRYWRDGATGAEYRAYHVMDAEEIRLYLGAYLKPHIDQYSRSLQTASFGFQIMDQEGLSFIKVWQPGGGRDADGERRITSVWGDWKLEYWFEQVKQVRYQWSVLFVGGMIASMMIASFVVAYRRKKQEQKEHEQRADFLMRVAHDLRTPMTAIHLESDVIRQMLEEGDVSTVDRRFQRVQSNILRMSQLLSNALDYARGARLGAETACDLTLSLESVLDSYRPVLDQAGIEMEVSGWEQAQGRWIIAFEVVERIVLNLLDNVRRHAADGKWVGIELDASQAGTFSFTISDRGQGLAGSGRDESHLRQEKGSGLGLRIAKELSEACGGGLQAIEDDDGMGFQFWVRARRIKES